MEKRVFKLYQYKDNEGMGCTWSLLLGLIGFVLIFFSFAKIGPGILLIFAAIVGISEYIGHRHNSKCTLTVAEDGFTIDVLEAGPEIEPGKSTFAWKDLLIYRYYYGGGSRSLELHIANAGKIILTGYFTSHLSAFLEKHFPEKNGW